MEEEEEEGEEEKKEEEEEEEEEETEPNMDYYMDNMHEVEDDDEVWSTRASFDRYSLSGPKVYNSLKVLVHTVQSDASRCLFFRSKFHGGGGGGAGGGGFFVGTSLTLSHPQQETIANKIAANRIFLALTSLLKGLSHEISMV